MALSMNTAASSPRDQMTRLMDGYLSTQMLYVATRLGLADLLSHGPRTSAELAATAGVASIPLHRLLRGLVMDGLLSEEPDGRFALTAAGRLLRADDPGSLRGAVLARGAPPRQSHPDAKRPAGHANHGSHARVVVAVAGAGAVVTYMN
jgi:hypothetical protein